MEDFCSKLNVNKSAKLFSPYINEDMGNVCIVREIDDKGVLKSGIFDIFAEIGFYHDKLKGFRYADRELTKEEKVERDTWLDDGFVLFSKYIKENYNVDFSMNFSKYINSLCFFNHYTFICGNMQFTIYDLHRRIHHRCFDEYFDLKQLRTLGICTITEKGSGRSSQTWCSLCLGDSLDMGEKEYNYLNEVRNFLE